MKTLTNSDRFLESLYPERRYERCLEENRFELCTTKNTDVRIPLVDALVQHIKERKGWGYNEYALMPGVRGITEKMLANKLPKCSENKPVKFVFFESDASKKWCWGYSKAFRKTVEKLRYKGYDVEYRRMLDGDLSVNGGWSDLCAPRTNKIVELVSRILLNLKGDNGLMFFTWGETWTHIPEKDRSYITPETLSTILTSIDGEYAYTVSFNSGVYINTLSESKKMITFGITKTRKNIVDISVKSAIIPDDMKNTNKTKRTVQDYIRLSNRGFTNKQIAVYWRTTVRSIGAYQANANR